VLKYLDQIVGQPKVVKLLSNFLNSDKIPHAFLFTGENGLGKEHAAFCFSKELNSTHNSEDVISQISNLAEPFIKYIFPLPRGKNENNESSPYEKLNSDEMTLVKDELQKKISNPYYKISIPKANLIKVNSIRDLRKFISMSYSDINYRTVIISDAHLMNEESQNALLKNLEEPPSGVIFILITSKPDMLRETIKSRCWEIKFDYLKNEDLISILTKYFNYSNVQAENYAAFSFGTINEFLFMEGIEFEDVLNRTIVILRFALGRKFHSAIDEINKMVANDIETFKLLLFLILRWFNDLQKFKVKKEISFFVNHKETFQKFLTKFPEIKYLKIVTKIENLISLCSKNINLNILISDLVVELGKFTVETGIRTDKSPQKIRG
jgi:DNA polymerase-3 subunit delta'